jgi:hypothetical protein
MKMLCTLMLRAALESGKDGAMTLNCHGKRAFYIGTYSHPLREIGN